MIRTVIRTRNGMVMVFDESGEQMPQYQGQYEEVRDKIVADAAAGTVFNHWFGVHLPPERISSQKW